MLELENNLFYISASVSEKQYDKALEYLKDTKKLIKRLRRKSK